MRTDASYPGARAIWPMLLLSLMLILGSAAPARADFIVASGWDLLVTQPGTTFDNMPLEGVPLETFDFGGAIGVRDVGLTDTIVERLAAADSGGVPGPAPVVPIELVALQLKSPDGAIFVTLQSARGGPASTGGIFIDFTDETRGTFNSILQVFFDVRTGALDGPIIQSGLKVFNSTAIRWRRLPPNGAIQIFGANSLLKGDGTRVQDFWPVALTERTSDDSARHVVRSAARFVGIPTLSGLGLAVLVLGLLALALWTMRRSKRAGSVPG